MQRQPRFSTLLLYPPECQEKLTSLQSINRQTYHDLFVVQQATVWYEFVCICAPHSVGRKSFGSVVYDAAVYDAADIRAGFQVPARNIDVDDAS